MVILMVVVGVTELTMTLTVIVDHGSRLVVAVIIGIVIMTLTTRITMTAIYNVFLQFLMLNLVFQIYISMWSVH